MKIQPALSVTICAADGRVSRRGTASDLPPVMLDGGEQSSGHAATVPGLPSQAPLVRRYLRGMVDGLPVEAERVELLGSEVFSNAVRHSRSGDPGGAVTVGVHALRGRVQVRVIDAGPRPGKPGGPWMRPLDVADEGGFGLHLLAVEASRWGAVHHDDGRTSVWFDIDHTEQPHR